MMEAGVPSSAKRICLIENGRPLWSEVKSLLGGVNADLFRLSGNPTVRDVLSIDPDLIIVGNEEHRRLLGRIGAYPAIVLEEGSPPVTRVWSTEERNTVLAGWPMSREALLALTSGMISVPPRKDFRSLIRIFREEEDVCSLGQSRDFSRSGMAFTSAEKLKRGTRILLSFSLPDEEGSLKLAAQIVRVTLNRKADGVCYGACFLEIPRRAEARLNAFLKG